MVAQCSVEVHGHSHAHGGVMWRWHWVVVFDCRSGVGWRCLSATVVLGVVVMEAREILKFLEVLQVKNGMHLVFSLQEIQTIIRKKIEIQICDVPRKTRSGRQ